MRYVASAVWEVRYIIHISRYLTAVMTQIITHINTAICLLCHTCPAPVSSAKISMKEIFEVGLMHD